MHNEGIFDAVVWFLEHHKRVIPERQQPAVQSIIRIFCCSVLMGWFTADVSACQRRKSTGGPSKSNDMQFNKMSRYE